MKKSGKEVNVNYIKSYICKLTNATRKILYQTKKKILRDNLNSGNNKTKTLCEIAKTLTSDRSENTLPTATSHKELADTFANFFVDKVTKIRSK